MFDAFNNLSIEKSFSSNIFFPIEIPLLIGYPRIRGKFYVPLILHYRVRPKLVFLAGYRISGRISRHA